MSALPARFGSVSNDQIQTSAEAATTPDRPTSPGYFGRIPVAKVGPVIEAGSYPARAVVSELVKVRANIFREGRDAVAGSVILTSPSGVEQRSDMHQVWPAGLDIWEGWVTPDAEGEWSFRVEGWSDPWHTWLHNAEAKLPLDQDVELVCMEGRSLLERAANDADAAGDRTSAKMLRNTAEMLLADRPALELIEAVHSHSMKRVMERYVPRDFVTPTPEYPLRVERTRALFSSWYEFFPRSQGAHVDSDTGSWVSGTFDSSHERLEAAAAMGFDIVYLPPIHPIGMAFRKGKNNSLEPDENDPGSPWAIGSPEGGHDAIHPDLGTFEDFDRFVAKARELGLEVALDFALQASPDHPWATEHPEWFTTRMDGTIAYAENPPKKYQDIYPINLDNDPDGIYHESLRLINLWIEHGVTIFRVDNPHTKPLDFWTWLLEKVHQTNPEVIFLAEAFTRPEMMHALGKVGFQQSYTYFTWRNTKQELTEYLTELSQEMAGFYRPNFFVNTPDINPTFLQSGTPAAFAIRAVLAATLSPTWGVYSGFELCEHEVFKPGGEEYLNAEKYEYRPRNYNAQPNISMLIGKLNHIRHEVPALQQLRTIVFHETSHPELIAYSKTTGDSHALVVCSLSPNDTVEGEVYLDMEALGVSDNALLKVEDLLNGGTFTWGQRNFVRLTTANPAHVFTVSTT